MQKTVTHFLRFPPLLAVFVFMILAVTVTVTVSAFEVDSTAGFLLHPVLCSEGQENCGLWHCYVPGGDEVCYHNRALCNATRGELPCGFRCYDPAAAGRGQQCIRAGGWEYICEQGQVVCGTKCYTVFKNAYKTKQQQQQRCLETPFGHYMCGAEEEACGSWGCFSPDQYKCFEDVDLLCEHGQVPCGTFDCYDPGSQTEVCTVQGYLINIDIIAPKPESGNKTHDK